jgi:hypothetical protein
MALDGSHGAPEGSGQGIHPRPAQTILVVGVVGKGAVRRDRFKGDALGD